MHLAAIFIDARVPGDHGNAALHRAAERRRNGVRVVGGNRDGINALRDERVDDLNLAFRGGIGRAGVDDLDIAEFGRAGGESVGRTQLESAAAIGLTKTQTFRYVVFPQALRATLPPLAGQLATLIKDSSLLSVIAVAEFTRVTQNTVAITYTSFEGYLPLAAGYLVLTLPLSLWTQNLERHLRYEA